ncbi:hypothetical protein [Endozoicomonas acroporae]|uniref:hypothetical protein n=1 Tax=Endozoicomonas acroporae TaxID=1701104 RepID=UPI000C789FC2|nr:hypothetical protein [Endozoicomonas acroporae]
MKAIVGQNWQSSLAARTKPANRQAFSGVLYNFIDHKTDYKTGGGLYRFSSKPRANALLTIYSWQTHRQTELPVLFLPLLFFIRNSEHHSTAPFAFNPAQVIHFPHYFMH